MAQAEQTDTQYSDFFDTRLAAIGGSKPEYEPNYIIILDNYCSPN